MIQIRKAAAADIDAVTDIYNAIHAAEESGEVTIGWARNIYPTRSTAETALSCGELYVLEFNGKIAAAAKINQSQEKAYYDINWKYTAEDNEVLVLHTLVVDPAMSGNGLGPKFVEFYECTAAKLHCKALRIDTNARNTRARRLYKKLGYIESGIISTTFNGISGVQLVCLEKRIDPDREELIP